MGDGAVGKSALRKRYLKGEFDSNYLMTIGADFAVCDTAVDGHLAKLQIWDLSGQDRFDQVRSLYYKGSHGAVLAYDVTRRDTYLNAERWISELLKNLKGPSIPIILLGNKVDLRMPVPEHIQEEQGQKMAEIISEKTGKTVIFMETSAKTGENVDTAFESLASEIVKGASSE